jgi:hypothetical protein
MASKIVEIDKGLFLIRYATAEDMERPPVVRIVPEKASDKNVTLILHPDQTEAALWQPGSTLVVRTTGPAKLSVDVSSVQEGGSTNASVKIEALTQGNPSPQSKDSGGLDLSDFQVLGHVAGIGDVVVATEEWLAGPSAPSRIEGISIDWPTKPRDLDIRYSVKLAKPQAVSGQLIGLGSFAGTRGRALPVIGMILEMSGPRASSCQFVIEAAFLGSPIKRMTGRRIVLTGPTEREPLVGLRIGVKEIAAARPTTPQSQVSQVSRSSSRIRVFRGRPKQDLTVVA